MLENPYTFYNNYKETSGWAVAESLGAQAINFPLYQVWMTDKINVTFSGLRIGMGKLHLEKT